MAYLHGGSMSDSNGPDPNSAATPDSSDRLRAVTHALTTDSQFADLQAHWGLRAADAENLVAEVAMRLRHVCADLDDEKFAALVLDIARMKVRFAGKELLLGLPAFGNIPMRRS
jgi:hypothetical protein